MIFAPPPPPAPTNQQKLKKEKGKKSVKLGMATLQGDDHLGRRLRQAIPVAQLAKGTCIRADEAPTELAGARDAGNESDGTPNSRFPLRASTWVHSHSLLSTSK